MLEAPTIITKNHLLSSANDFTPLNHTTRTSTTDTNSWALSNLDTRITSDSWDRPTSISPITRKPHSAFPANMSSRQDNKHIHPASAVDPSSRWRFNNTGQLVDPETAGWDLSDEIVRLKISDGKEDGSVRTPPQSRLSGAVAQLVESSPLETASSASSSPHNSDRQGPSSHSRGPSVDSTTSAAHKLAPPPSLKIDTNGEPKGRPHSYSGTLSTADLRRLQTAGESPVVESSESPINQWTPTQFRGESNPEQLPYPSLANNLPTMQRQAAQNAAYASDLRSGQSSDYGNFGAAAQFVPGRPNMTYRPAPRGYPQQGMVSPSSLGFSGTPQQAPLSNNQQLYEMMLSENNPQSGNRQVPNNFRGAHQHSSSDPSIAREAAIAALNSGMPPFAPGPGMFPATSLPGMAMYANQFYPQEAYQRGDPSQILAARLQAQYTGSQSYGMMTPPPMEAGMSGPPSSTGSSQNGPSANNRKLGLYKTELCRSWEEKGTCRYGTKCQFAHGEDELRNVSRHPKYKTEICRTFWVSGSCPYGKRCCFIHTELPVPGAPAPGGIPGNIEHSPQLQHHDGRARSMSTNSDPNEGGGTSLLARISAKRTQDSNTNSSTPVDNNSPYQLSRPPTGSLRVDTSSLDTTGNKQNKSAYPTYASNGVGVLKPTSDNVTLRSPVPVTAGPDFGRQSSARNEIVGYNRGNKSGTPPTHNPRHSFSGTEDINFGSSPPHPGPTSSYTLESAQPAQGHRLNGHVRSGSAGNWGSFTASRNSSHLSNSAYPSSPVGGDITSPWSTTELTSVGPSRLSDKAWA